MTATTEKTVTVTKQITEVYHVKTSAGTSRIILEPIGNGGAMVINSPWGVWSHGWGACGTSFKKFIIDLAKDRHYFAGKVGQDRFKNIYKTLIEWKKRVIEARKSEEIKAEFARKVWNEIVIVESEHDLDFAIRMDNLMQFFEFAPDTVTEISPAFNRFFDEHFLPFVEELKKEVEQ